MTCGCREGRASVLALASHGKPCLRRKCRGIAGARKRWCWYGELVGVAATGTRYHGYHPHRRGSLELAEVAEDSKPLWLGAENRRCPESGAWKNERENPNREHQCGRLRANVITSSRTGRS